MSVRLNRIYTRSGDAGTTALARGGRVAKTGLRVSAFGAVDEVNAALGLVRSDLREVSGLGWLDDLLAQIQNELFDLGADLACPQEAGTKQEAEKDKALRIVPAQVEALEQAIDKHNESLAPLTSFILPGGTRLAAGLHLARTFARRAERALFALAEAEAVSPPVLHYMNRLSDLLFVLARVANDPKHQGTGDILWEPGSTR